MARKRRTSSDRAIDLVKLGKELARLRTEAKGLADAAHTQLAKLERDAAASVRKRKSRTAK